MSFPVTIQVPETYRWQNIEPSLINTLNNVEIEIVNEALISHYEYLLNITSWKFDINWEPSKDVITVELPLSGTSLGLLDMAKDQNDYDNDIAIDPISGVLAQVMQLVPVNRLIAHFKEMETRQGRRRR